jgi:hypothetical protein
MPRWVEVAQHLNLLKKSAHPAQGKSGPPPPAVDLFFLFLDLKN